MFFNKLLSGAGKDQRDVFKLNFWASVGLLVLFILLPRIAQILGVVQIVKVGALSGGCYGSSCESLFGWYRFLFVAFFVHFWIFCFWIFKKILLVNNKVLVACAFIALLLSFLYFVAIVFTAFSFGGSGETWMIPGFVYTMFCDGRSDLFDCTNSGVFTLFYFAVFAFPALYYICVYIRYRVTKKSG